MGVTIRHLTRLLNEVEAHTRLLITLPDGKPDDYDTCRGAWRIEDRRMALIEVKRSGIHPYCITIDTEARDYLSHMYGVVNDAVIDEVQQAAIESPGYLPSTHDLRRASMAAVRARPIATG